MKNQLSVFYEHIVDAQSQTGLPLETVCEKVKGFGFDFGGDRRQAPVCGERNDFADAPSARGSASIASTISSTSARRAARRKRTARRRSASVDLCGPAKCNKVLAVTGFLTEAEMDRSGAAYAKRRDAMAASLGVLIELAAAQGVTVVMEDFDGDSAPFSTAAELLWFMQNVPGLRCGFDTGNFLYSEEDAAAVLPDFLPYISAVHCKDRGWAKNAGEPKITVVGPRDVPGGGRRRRPRHGRHGADHSGRGLHRRVCRRAFRVCRPAPRYWSARRSI